MRTLTITCDCCKKEIQEGSVYQVEHYIHVDPSFNRMQGHAKSIDGKMYSVSGHTVIKEFCLPCYNKLFSLFFDSMNHL